MDPPPSLPIPPAEQKAAMAAASPPLEPPGVRSRSHGLLVRPSNKIVTFRSCIRNSGQLVLPRMIAPAARRRATAVESVSAPMALAEKCYRRGGQTGYIEAVLHGDRHAVKQAQGILEGSATASACLAAASASSASHHYESVQLRITSLDLAEVGLDHSTRRDLPVAYHLGHQAKRKRTATNYKLAGDRCRVGIMEQRLDRVFVDFARKKVAANPARIADCLGR